MDATVTQVLRDENRYAKVPGSQPDVCTGEQIPEHLREVTARFLKFWESPDGAIEHRLKELLAAILSERRDPPEGR
jgi:hypothetical protein